MARLSPRYPTVEVRVADACLDAGIAVLLAGLTRALVATALAEARRGTPLPAVPARWVNAALAAAARRGLAGPGVDPFTGQAADARSLRSRLLGHVYPALSDLGDAQIITGLLHRLDDRGTGADRQRALFASAGSAPSFVEALARATLSGDEPPAAVSRTRNPSGRRQLGRQGWLPSSPSPGRHDPPVLRSDRTVHRRRTAPAHAQRPDLAQPADKRQIPRPGNLQPRTPKGPVTCISADLARRMVTFRS